MRNSVVTFEKAPHRSLSDWHSHCFTIQQITQTRRDDSNAFRYSSRQLRNEINIRTNWDTYHNNARLADRVVTLDRWRETINALRDRIDSESYSLKDEKTANEHDLDMLGNFISIVAECIAIRDSRIGAENTSDDADTELKKELCVLEDIKKMLTDRCHSAWEKLNQLQEVRFKLSLDIENKTSALEIDKNQLNSDSQSANVTSKLNALRTPKSTVTFDTWLEHCHHLKLLAENELADTSKLREALFTSRERARNDMRMQRDCADFTIRKRIYETQKCRNEMSWQKLTLNDEMNKLQKEIEVLTVQLQTEKNSLKLVETRLENRYLRSGPENCRDEAETGLRAEVDQLRQSIQDILDKLNYAKSTYNALEEQLLAIDRNLQNKNHSLMLDIKCLDLRIRLRSEADDKSQMDRNIQLTNMEHQIRET